MVLNVVLLRFILIGLTFWCTVQAKDFLARTQDQTSARANTLSDDADDIQRQLDNEARDRMKYGKPKTIWVFHLPTQFPEINLVEKVTRPLREINDLRQTTIGYNNTRKNKKWTCMFCNRDWNYKGQYDWPKRYPECGGRSQSPVDLPYHSLIAAKAGRKLLFKNYNVKPEALKLINDGNQVTLYGKWKDNIRPYIYGGAAHSRRYVFYSITLHWPSEHSVGGLQYPMESQVMHISADYHSMDEALQASKKDPLAFLAISTLYRFANHTQEGLYDLIKAAMSMDMMDKFLEPKPLSHFSPPFKEYACYQGSLTAPPCTEAVLWLVRGRTLPVTRKMVDAARNLLGMPDETGKVFFRSTQPLNDRKTYFFKN